MEEINQAIQASMTREEERTQLIENILMSEIKYAEYKKEITTATVEQATYLQKYIDSDDETIATWMTNYGITFDDLDRVRQTVFTKAKEKKEEVLNEEEKDIQDSINRLTAQLVEVPAKKEEMRASIDSLSSKPNHYRK